MKAILIAAAIVVMATGCATKTEVKEVVINNQSTDYVSANGERPMPVYWYHGTTLLRDGFRDKADKTDKAAAAPVVFDGVTFNHVGEFTRSQPGQAVFSYTKDEKQTDLRLQPMTRVFTYSGVRYTEDTPRPERTFSRSIDGVWIPGPNQ